MKIKTTKVTEDTIKNAKKISAITGEKQYMVIDRTVRDEAVKTGVIKKVTK